MKYEDVRWGIEACSIEGCAGDAEILWDDQTLLCILCADRLLERTEILGVYGRDLFDKLPPFSDWAEKIHPYKEWGKDDSMQSEDSS